MSRIMKRLAQLVECQTLDRKFESHQGRGVVSLSKTLNPHWLVLVNPRNLSQNDRKIVDRDVKLQTNKNLYCNGHKFLGS